MREKNIGRVFDLELGTRRVYGCPLSRSQSGTLKADNTLPILIANWPANAEPPPKMASIGDSAKLNSVGTYLI